MQGFTIREHDLGCDAAGSVAALRRRSRCRATSSSPTSAWSWGPSNSWTTRGASASARPRRSARACAGAAGVGELCHSTGGRRLRPVRRRRRAGQRGIRPGAGERDARPDGAAGGDRGQRRRDARPARGARRAGPCAGPGGRPQRPDPRSVPAGDGGGRVISADAGAHRCAARWSTPSRASWAALRRAGGGQPATASAARRRRARPAPRSAAEGQAPHSWFIGFAPGQQGAAPTIAVAVLVEGGGSGSGRAAPDRGTGDGRVAAPLRGGGAAASRAPGQVRDEPVRNRVGYCLAQGERRRRRARAQHKEPAW